MMDSHAVDDRRSRRKDDEPLRHPLSAPDPLETLDLDDNDDGDDTDGFSSPEHSAPRSFANSNYCSAITSLSSSPTENHFLSGPPSAHPGSDPLHFHPRFPLPGRSTPKSFSNYGSAMPSLSSSPTENSYLSGPTSAAPGISVSDRHLLPPRGPSTPSYADVIVSAFHGKFPDSSGKGQTFNNSELSSPLSESSSSEYLDIVVSNPRKEIEPSNSFISGGNTYVSYQITTATNIADYGGSSFSVRRRFNDVITLSDRLTESYRGFFVPPRPDKSVVESQVMQKQDFLEQRRVELEKYLRRLAKHPLIVKSDELRVFLTVEGRMPLPTSIDMASRVRDGATKLPKQLLRDTDSVIDPQEVVHPATGGSDILRFFKEWKQAVVNDWSNSQPPLVKEDIDFLEQRDRLWELERHLINASKQAESLVKAQQEIAETMGELGLAFMKLTKFENEHASMATQRTRAADTKSVATTVVKASRFYRGLNGQTVKQFDTLLEYMVILLAAHNAFSDRASALLTVQTLMSDLSSLHTRYEYLEAENAKAGGNNTRNPKLDDLKEAIRVTEDAKSCAVKEYQRIKKHNRNEIIRLDGERRVDFIEMLKGFVGHQMSYHEKIGNEWSKLAEEMKKYAEGGST